MPFKTKKGKNIQVIDVNMHILPEKIYEDEALLASFLRSAPRAFGEGAHLTTVPGTDTKMIVIEKPKGYAHLYFSQKNVDAAARIETMDQAGIDKAILRTPCWQEWLSLEMCQVVNDNMAKVVGEHPDRFYGVAITPPWGDKFVFAELERCVKDLGFVGVEVAAHYGNFYLDDKMFRPYLKKLNELNVPVIVHHTPMPADYHNLYDYKNQCMIMGRCVDQMTAIGRELYSGLFDECPNLRCIHTCLGGGIFALSDFIMPRVSPTKEEIERYDSASLQKVGEQFRNNIFYDTTSPNAWGKIQMECAIKVLGADHILYAASYPVRLDWVFNSPNFMDNLDITEEEKELIFSGNAKRLFNLK